MANIERELRVLSNESQFIPFRSANGEVNTRQVHTLVLVPADWDGKSTPFPKFTIETFTTDGINTLGADVGKVFKMEISTLEPHLLPS